MKIDRNEFEHFTKTDVDRSNEIEFFITSNKIHRFQQNDEFSFLKSRSFCTFCNDCTELVF